MNPKTGTILEHVGEERVAQLAKWGVQHHGPARWLAILAEEFGEVAREATELEFDSKMPTYVTSRLRNELVQVAAVAVAWIEDMGRNEL